MRLPDSNFELPRRAGHAHFWQRAMSRRGFVKGSLGVAGAAAALSATPVWIAEAAKRSLSAAPKPIPGGFTFNGIQFHTFFPGFGSENSTITDFVGTVGFADVQGTGTTGDGQPLLFDSDMRFMKGVYVGQDGRTRSGTFAFV